MKELQEAIWVAKSLFDRNKVSGSSANLSIKVDNNIYITRSGGCFGNLTKNDFFIVGKHESNDRFSPSKELPLHKIMYEGNENIKAVLHTHSTFSTYQSCVLEPKENGLIVINTPTPYLEMKVGKIGWVGYEKPGSEELFCEFRKSYRNDCRAYMMKNHGIIVGSDNIMDAFFMIEEIEEASLNNWLLK